jgi:hypothetical protein
VLRPALEVADIFRDHGAAWRHANSGHLSLGQLKVMSAIESCRTAVLGEAVLAYLSRYTHRVAISNSRLIAIHGDCVTFRVKDYRREGPDRYRSMTLEAAEFIRRFLLHVLPKGFHRIRHYGFFANGARAETITRIRQLLADNTPQPQPAQATDHPHDPNILARPCPCCGGRMIIIETFERGAQPRRPPSAPSFATSIDTS